MSDFLDKALEAVRQLRELGATHIRVGDLEVTFPPQAPQVVDPLSLDGSQESEPTENPLDARKRWEEEQYFSSGAGDIAGLERIVGRQPR